MKGSSQDKLHPNIIYRSTFSNFHNRPSSLVVRSQNSLRSPRYRYHAELESYKYLAVIHVQSAEVPSSNVFSWIKAGISVYEFGWLAYIKCCNSISPENPVNTLRSTLLRIAERSTIHRFWNHLAPYYMYLGPTPSLVDSGSLARSYWCQTLCIEPSAPAYWFETSQ